MNSRAATLVLGVGNILMRDEGVGVRAAEVLAQEGLPDGVEALDGGTLGIDLIDLIADRDRLVVIDTVRGGKAPGSLYRLRPEDLLQPDVPHLSLHQAGLLEALQMARHLGCAPRDVVILGVEPAVLDYGIGLSEQVRGALPAVTALARREVAGSEERAVT